MSSAAFQARGGPGFCRSRLEPFLLRTCFRARRVGRGQGDGTLDKTCGRDGQAMEKKKRARLQGNGVSRGACPRNPAGLLFDDVFLVAWAVWGEISWSPAHGGGGGDLFCRNACLPFGGPGPGGGPAGLHCRGVQQFRSPAGKRTNGGGRQGRGFVFPGAAPPGKTDLFRWFAQNHPGLNFRFPGRDTKLNWTFFILAPR